MATILKANGLDDERLRDYVSLRDVHLRKLLETRRGVYVAEGEKVLRRSLQAGHTPRSFLMAPRWLESLRDVLDAVDVPCFVLDESRIEELTGFHVHRGALAAMERPEPRTPASLLETSRRVVVVEDVMDHTNVGAIFRNAAGLGFDAVLLSPRCADPLYRRAIKVSMGAVFELPYARLEDWYEAPAVLHESGFMTVALTLAPDAVELDRVKPTERVALLVGAEGDGLTERWTREAQVRAVIPMREGIDSLNVAAATAVACWHFRPAPGDR